MGRRATLPVGLLAVICSLIYSVPGGAQSPPASKRCSVAADADDNAPHGKRISAAEVDAPHRKVIIERIQFTHHFQQVFSPPDRKQPATNSIPFSTAA